MSGDDSVAVEPESPMPEQATTAPPVDELRAWAYLASVSEPPARAVARLIDAVGVLDAARAVRTRCFPDGHADADRATSARHERDTAREDLETVARLGGRLLTPGDADWPGWALHGLSTADTAARGGPPLVLWARGEGSVESMTARAVALVGSRAASGYGTHMTSILASGLVGTDRAVISGGAYGIDAAAHRAALGSGGPTIAVMACGVDVDYPTSHSRLFTEIARSGLILTEYPPGMSASAHRFLCRNRLVAALSRAVVVVEANHRSGAKNTAAWARKLGVPLGAVPGPATSSTSVGCHALIADGDAHLVGDIAGVERLVSPDGTDALSSSPRARGEVDPIEDRVRAAITPSGSTMGEIAARSGLAAGRVRSVLARMEARGRARSDGSTWTVVT